MFQRAGGSSCVGASVLRALALKQASASVVFHRKREKALVIKARELKINTADHFKAPKLGTKHFPLPSSPNEQLYYL